MNISTPWFLRRLVEALKPAPEPDAADLGTAYGMECSLAAQEPHPLPQTGTTPAPPAAPR
jgi:hypothetical protein